MGELYGKDTVMSLATVNGDNFESQTAARENCVVDIIF